VCNLAKGKDNRDSRRTWCSDGEDLPRGLLVHNMEVGEAILLTIVATECSIKAS
jgi:hypothetical protein